MVNVAISLDSLKNPSWSQLEWKNYYPIVDTIQGTVANNGNSMVTEYIDATIRLSVDTRPNIIYRNWSNNVSHKFILLGAIELHKFSTENYL